MEVAEVGEGGGGAEGGAEVLDEVQELAGAVEGQLGGRGCRTAAQQAVSEQQQQLERSARNLERL